MRSTLILLTLMSCVVVHRRPWPREILPVSTVETPAAATPASAFMTTQAPTP